MTKEKPPTREERLAAQLRDNLRRRKAQARAMSAGESAPGGGPSPDLPSDNAGLSKTPPAR